MVAQAYRDFIERVRGATDLVRLISDTVPLRKRGRRHTGLCPFHPEKTPSFSVDEEKQLFFCFGCQAGGDAFRFVMLTEGLTFPDAARFLGEKAGIEPPAASRAPRRHSDHDVILEIHREAASFFRRSLREGRTGARAREYLERRGVSDETVEALGIGYAPKSWDALKSHLLEARFEARKLARCGLFSPRDDGSGYFDRFRDRVMFPIVGMNGKVLAFGGRIIGEDGPKYLNSPETPIYRKGENLYGLSWSKEAIRRAGQAIVVEGYLDYAALHQAGIGNAVATCGTAFTPEQARILARYANRVTVNYDADAAGVSAAKRSLDVLLGRGFQVKVLRLDGGLDPDAFVRARGAGEYGAALEAAPGYIDFLLEEAVRDRDLSVPAARVDALNEVLPHVCRLDNPAERSGYYGRIAEAIGIDDDLVLQQLSRALRAGRGSITVESGSPAGGGRVPEVPDVEARLVRSLLDHAEARREVLEGLTAEEIGGLTTGSIISALIDLHREGREPSVTDLMDRLPEGDPRDLLTRITFEQAETEVSEDALICVSALRRERMIAERRRLQKEIDAAGRTVPEALLARKMELSRKINELS